MVGVFKDKSGYNNDAFIVEDKKQLKQTRYLLISNYLNLFITKRRFLQS